MIKRHSIPTRSFTRFSCTCTEMKVDKCDGAVTYRRTPFSGEYRGTVTGLGLQRMVLHDVSHTAPRPRLLVMIVHRSIVPFLSIRPLSAIVGHLSGPELIVPHNKLEHSNFPSRAFQKLKKSRVKLRKYSLMPNYFILAFLRKVT